jgi:hypothetical protein
MTQQPRRIAEEAKRVGQEIQQEAERTGRQFQRAGEQGFDAMAQSWSELNQGWASIAAEVTGYSKSALEDATRAWERVIRAKTLGDVVEVQTEYAKKAYDNHIAQVSKLGQMYTRILESAFKPVQETAKRFD